MLSLQLFSRLRSSGFSEQAAENPLLGEMNVIIEEKNEHLVRSFFFLVAIAENCFK